jgi:hypothetical protein
VPRHVLLLTRDASLVVAVKVLLDHQDRVSELGAPQELPPAGELPVDAVVVDLPRASRADAVERVRGRFSGPLVVLLGHGEDPAEARVFYRCSVLPRPFGMSQLWSMLVDSATEAVTQVIPPVHRGAPSQHPRRDPPADPSPDPPLPAPAAGRPAAEGRVPSATPPTPDSPPPVPNRATEPARGERAPVPGATRAARADARAGRRADRATRENGTVPAWSWRLRRFQHAPAESPDPGELTQPMPRVPPSGNGLPPPTEHRGPLPEAPARAQAQPPVEAPRAGATPRASGPTTPPVPPPSTAAQEEPSPDPPEAVAGRLAERLGADAVALLLDNDHGLLEVAGGVGLTTGERQLQVEYGHEVLAELFRVGVGLIEDTDRVRELIHDIPGSRSQSLIMVPLVHEGHGFGALILGRTSKPGQPHPEFTEAEIEALMDFAEDVAAPLRSTVLLRRLRGQLNGPDRT